MKKKNSIQYLTFKEIEKRVSRIPAIIFPIGGMEPVGEQGALGAIQELVSAISNCLSERCDILLQPILSYSNTTSYRSFGGSSGMKQNIYESSITGIIKDCVSWGIKYIFILEGTYNSNSILEKVIKRIEKNKKLKVQVHLFNWQHDKKIRSFAGKHLTGNELARSEFGILSMISYLNPSMICANKSKKKAKSLCTEDTYRRWSKLGQDPDKFRKLFPDCSTSLIENDIDPEFGKELFTYITDYYSKEIKKIITIQATKSPGHKGKEK